MDAKRCCGTCRRWEPMDKDYGICRLAKNVTDSPIKRRNDMTGCLGWKEADPWDLEMRGFELDGK